MYLAQSDDDLSRMISLCEGQVILDAFFPGQVFTGRDRRFAVVEWMVLQGSMAEPLLAALGDEAGDAVLTLVDLSNTLPNADILGGSRIAYEIPFLAGTVDYGKAMYEPIDEQDINALTFNCERIAICGWSESWAIYAQRDWEIGVLSVDPDIRAWESAGVKWFDPGFDFAELIPPPPWGPELSKEEIVTFRANFA